MYILHAAYVTQWPLAQSKIHIWLLILYNLCCCCCFGGCCCYIIEMKTEKKKTTTNDSKLLWQRKKTENTHTLTHMHTWIFRSLRKWDGHLVETNRNTFFLTKYSIKCAKWMELFVDWMCIWIWVCVRRCPFCVGSSYWNFFKNFICFTFRFYCSFISSSDSKWNVKHCINQIVSTHTHTHTSVYNAVCYAIFDI